MHLICWTLNCNTLSSHQLEEIFRKKKDRKEVAEDVQRFDQQVWFAFKYLLTVVKAAVISIFYINDVTNDYA